VATSVIAIVVVLTLIIVIIRVSVALLMMAVAIIIIVIVGRIARHVELDIYSPGRINVSELTGLSGTF
jgi:hypothetical protein